MIIFNKENQIKKALNSIMKFNNFRFLVIFSNFIFVNVLYFIDYTFITEYFKLFEVYILLLFSLLVYFNIKYFGFFHIMVFFHSTFLLFVLGKVPADLFDIASIQEFYSLVNNNFEIITIIEALLISVLSLLAINLFSFFFIPKKLKLLNSNKLYVSIGKKIMLFSFPLIFIKLYIEYKFIMTVGYVSYYAGAATNIHYPFILIGISHMIFSFGYFIFLAGIPELKKFKLYSYIFLFIMLMDALKGSRGVLVLPILFYFWYLGNFYEINIKKYKKIFIIFSIILISFSQFYAQYRLDSSKSYDYSKILSFLTDQGRSVSLLSLYIENKNSMPETTLGYIFEPLTFPFVYVNNRSLLSHGQNIDTVTLRENLNHRLTYYLNENYYLSGGGLGSSYIAEAYEFGYLGIILFSILLPYLISILYKYSDKRIVVFFSFYIVTHIFTIGRAEYFMNLWGILKYSILYVIFILILKILIKKDLKNVPKYN